MGEGGNREKGETSGELRGEDAVLSSALEKIKAVSVRLRWYRLNGLPGEKEQFVSSTNACCISKNIKLQAQQSGRQSLSVNELIWIFKSLFKLTEVHLPVREAPGLVGLCDDDDDSCLKNSLGFMDRWDTNAAASYRSVNVE